MTSPIVVPRACEYIARWNASRLSAQPNMSSPFSGQKSSITTSLQSCPSSTHASFVMKSCALLHTAIPRRSAPSGVFFRTPQQREVQVCLISMDTSHFAHGKLAQRRSQFLLPRAPGLDLLFFRLHPFQWLQTGAASCGAWMPRLRSIAQ